MHSRSLYDFRLAQHNVSSPSMPLYSTHAVATAFQGASRRFIPHLGQGIRCRMMRVARYAHRN